MFGERDINVLLKTMKPVLNAGEYVFCTIKDIKLLDISDAVLIFKETEGYTVVLEKEIADRLHFTYSYIASWITLTVHSSLEAVGLTAAFSNALAEKGISCNVVSGYFHDHIFVDKEDAGKAIETLNSLAK